MKTPLVSIIIACKNNAEYITQCLESVKNQTYQNLELIIVDNFSTDGTDEIARRYTPAFYQLGPERSTQFNYGFKQSHGEVIYRIGAEFVLDLDLVEKGVAKIMNEGFDALALHNRSVGESIWAKVRFLERESYRGRDDIVAVRFMKREVFESVGMFNEALVAGEDFDLHNRIVSASYKWGHLDTIEQHIGEPKTLGDVWKKFYYYGRTIRKYQQTTNTRKAVKQLWIFRPSFRALQKDLIKEPKMFLAFWWYTFIKYLAGFFGVLRGYPKELLKKDQPHDS